MFPVALLLVACFAVLPGGGTAEDDPNDLGDTGSVLLSPSDLIDIAIVGIHAFNDAGDPRAWDDVVASYHLEFLDRTTGFNDTGWHYEEDYLRKAQELGLVTCSYFSQDPIQMPLWGFHQNWYAKLPPQDRWRNPDVSIAADPHEHSGSRDLLGEVIRYDPGDSRVLMSECSPAWLDDQMDSIDWALGLGLQAINVDLITLCPTSNGGDFSIWSKLAFQDHLENRYATNALASMGIDDVSTFDIQEYTLEQPWAHEVSQDHPWLRNPTDQDRPGRRGWAPLHQQSRT